MKYQSIRAGKSIWFWLYAIIFTTLFGACNSSGSAALPTATSEKALVLPTKTALPAPSDAVPTALPFQISSLGFEEDEIIPDRYACTGENLSPELLWGEPPAGTESLALILDDPDAPGGSWVHWVIFNLPADQNSLPEGVAPLAEHPDGSLSGSNSWGELGYGGPCPPQGTTHQYIFALYALDVELELAVGASKQDLLLAMDGHVLAETVLSGLFSR